MHSHTQNSSKSLLTQVMRGLLVIPVALALTLIATGCPRPHETDPQPHAAEPAVPAPERMPDDPEPMPERERTPEPRQMPDPQPDRDTMDDPPPAPRGY